MNIQHLLWYICGAFLHLSYCLQGSKRLTWRRRLWLQWQRSLRQKAQMQHCGFLNWLNHVPVWSSPSLSLNTKFKNVFCSLSYSNMFKLQQNLKILHQRISNYDSVENNFNATKPATFRMDVSSQNFFYVVFFYPRLLLCCCRSGVFM